MRMISTMTTSGESPPELPPAASGNDPGAAGDVSGVAIATADEVSDGDGVGVGVGAGVEVGAGVWEGAVPAPADSWTGVGLAVGVMVTSPIAQCAGGPQS
jgi:hypothetical protein